MQKRIYNITDAITFRKTNEAFGGLSNMAGGFTVNVGGITIPTVEHLYQSCRFPNSSSIQESIILERSPMNAKFISRKYDALSRKDWNEVRIKIMRWVLQIKLSQNWEKFSQLLLATDNESIVEFTRTDKMWGAIKEGDTLIGVNALGRLLMELREKFVKPNIQPYCVSKPDIKNFLLLGSEIDVVCNDTYMSEVRYSMQKDLELS